MRQPHRFFYYAAAATIGLAAGLLSTPAMSAERFDHVVRNDFFAGFTGDAAALARGMETCEKILATDPNHAEALVWHGSGVYFQAGHHFMKGEPEKGMPLAIKGLAEMDRAVEIAPDNVGVRIPRGAALAAAARTMSDNPHRKSLFDRVLADHMRAYELQKDHIDKLGTHPKGELLFAIADTYSRLGDTAKADEFFTMISVKMPDTPYAKRAAQWMETRKPLPLNQTACIGCHVSK